MLEQSKDRNQSVVRLNLVSRDSSDREEHTERLKEKITRALIIRSGIWLDILIVDIYLAVFK